MARNPFRTAAKALTGPAELKRHTTGSLLPAWRDGRAHWSEWDADKAIREGYKASTWVYACVSRIARAAARVPWTVSVRSAAGEWEPAPGHPLEQLLDRPNPWMTRSQLMQRLIAHLYLAGNGLWSKVHATVQGQRVPAELWPVGPAGVHVVPSRADFIERYEYRGEGGAVKRWRPDEIVHVQFPDPANPYWGMAPLQAAARAVDIDAEAANWNKAALQNRAVADGVFTFDQPLTLEQWDEARQMVREQHQGIQNARTPWVLGAGAKWHQMSMSPADMDFLGGRNYSRDEVVTIFGLHPAVFSNDASTFNNLANADRQMWKNVIVPLLDDIRDALQLALAPHFGPPGSLWLNYDTSSVEALREDQQQLWNTAQTMWRNGIPWQQIAVILDLDLEPFPGWDVPFVSTSVQPLAGADAARDAQMSDAIDAALRGEA